MTTLSRRDGRGQTLVEFALVLPIIVVLFIGTLDFARAIFTYNTLSESARQASRIAIVNQDTAAVTSAAISFAPATTLTAANVSVCFKSPTSLLRNCSSPSTEQCQPLRPGCLAIVTTTLDYSPLTPLITQIVGNITLSSTSVQPLEYACLEDCPT